MKNQMNVETDALCKNSIDILFMEIRRYNVLTDEENKDALERLTKGDKDARELLINSNLRLVRSKAKQYEWSGIPLEDLFQVGAMGLIQAVDRYDPTKGDCLRAYALRWIDGELLNAVKEHTKMRKVSLDAKASAREECERTLKEMLCSDGEERVDWDVRYKLAIKAIKAEVEKKFFAGAGALWEDYIAMKEMGYCLADVAKKHHVSEELAERTLAAIYQELLKMKKKGKI